MTETLQSKDPTDKFTSPHLTALIDSLSKNWSESHVSHEEFDVSLYKKLLAQFKSLNKVSSLFAKVRLGHFLYFIKLASFKDTDYEEMVVTTMMKLGIMFDKNQKRTFVRHTSRDYMNTTGVKDTLMENMIQTAYKKGDYEVVLCYQEDKDYYDNQLKDLKSKSITTTHQKLPKLTTEDKSITGILKAVNSLSPVSDESSKS
jgi:hypothetical protein